MKEFVAKIGFLSSESIVVFIIYLFVLSLFLLFFFFHCSLEKKRVRKFFNNQEKEVKEEIDKREAELKILLSSSRSEINTEERKEENENFV